MMPNEEELERLKRSLRRPYKEYMQSPEWEETRERKLRIVGYVCEECGYNPNKDWHEIKIPLDVHHLTYDQLGFDLHGRKF
jgi:hypothetical protein